MTQLASPCPFVPWDRVIGGLGLPVVHSDCNDEPLALLEDALPDLFDEERRNFCLANRSLLQRLAGQVMPFEASCDMFDSSVWRTVWRIYVRGL